MNDSPCVGCGSDNDENNWCQLCVGFLCAVCNKEHYCYEELTEEDMPAIAGDNEGFDELFKDTK